MCDNEEKLVVALELREGKYSVETYSTLASRIRQVISEDNGLTPQELLFLSPHTIPKTTSGKISRSRVKADYESNQLQVDYRVVIGGQEQEQEESLSSITITSTPSISTSTSASTSTGNVAQTTVAHLRGAQFNGRENERSGSQHGIEMTVLSPIEEQEDGQSAGHEVEITLPSQLDGVNTV